jgi:hypothetical protein
MNIENLHTLDRVKKIFKGQNNLFLVILITLVYFFIAFLPLPWPIQKGLDPSWSYAISLAAQKQLFFGQDIIFTYGPLGYLIAGATLGKNFFQITLFRWFIYLFLFIISILRIATAKTVIQQLFLALSIAFALFIDTPHVGVGMTPDYQILFICIIILSYGDLINRHPRTLSLLLGAASGFCALTKLTLGIYVFGSLNLFLLVSLYQSLIRRSKTGVVNNLFAIANSFLGAISIFLIFLVPARAVPSSTQIITNLFIAGAAGGLVWYLQKRIKEQSEANGEIEAKFFNIFRNSLLLPWLVFYVIYCLLLAHTISSSPSPSLIDYLRNSWQISSGYSSAMSLVRFRTVLALALSEFFLIICLIFFVVDKESFNLSLSLLFVLFLSFKHGFVRQDGHVVVFAIMVPIITSLLIIKTSRYRYQKIAYYLFAYMFAVSLLIALPAVSEMYRVKKLLPSQAVSNRVSLVDTKSSNLKIGKKSSVNLTKFQYRLNKLLPSQVINNLFFLINMSELQSKIEKKSIDNLSELKLPNDVKSLVNDKPVDIIPWEISLVQANQLNWKPKPVFQSYSAYTTTLDNINFDSMSKEKRDYLFYQFLSIDKRHPFFDEPRTFSYLFCNYEPSAEIPHFIKLPKLSNIILLEKLQESRCSPTSMSKRSSLLWDTPYDIKAESETAIILANVKFRYSLVGKIYKTLFRAPPVIMEANYFDGTQGFYRIIPENSENGVIVSHLPKNDLEAMFFFRGQLSARVKSFRFQTSNSLLYAPTIEMGFSSISLR